MLTSIKKDLNSYMIDIITGEKREEKRGQGGRKKKKNAYVDRFSKLIVTSSNLAQESFQDEVDIYIY